ncbi:MAG: hypothetical protein LBN18_08530 [Dysgonamonadaceae bacterium]|jgi:hypothetical protein|nr:hypothetical protein [Dysgonamonadaceae bacterium]
MALINNTDTFKQTVKIGKNVLFEVLSPFIKDAQRFYIEPYLGRPLIARLEAELADSETKVAELLVYAQRALGPFAYMLATHESSIGFGDSGHTVTRTDHLAPASDAKVERARESAEFRAWQNMEAMLQFLDENQTSFPEWEQSRYRRNPRPKYFRTAVEFQLLGMVDINNSRLTFEKLIELIRRIERAEVIDLITPEVDLQIGDPFTNILSNSEVVLVQSIQPYIAARAAALHTSQTTRLQRSRAGELEYRPVIRPLYEDTTDTGNYYSQQADYWKAKIIKTLSDMGIDQTGALKWNTDEKKLFCDIG